MEKKNTPDFYLDISSEFCPMTFVKTKMKLKKMNEGQILEVTLSDGEPIESVLENIEIDGHEILEKIVNGKNSKLLIKKK